MSSIKILFSLLITLYTVFASAKPIEINTEFESQKINALFYSFKPVSALDAHISDINSWQKTTGKYLNLGLDTRPVWIKFSINNTLNKEITPLLTLDNPLLNEVHVYQLQNTKLSSPIQAHNVVELSVEEIKSESLLTKINIPANSHTQIILKVSSKVGLRVPLTLWQQDAFLMHRSQLNLLYGVLIGFIFSLAISCFVLYGFSRKSYFIYTGVITLTFGLLLSYVCGFSFRYLHPNYPAIQAYAMHVLLTLATVLLLPLQQKICQQLPAKLLFVQKIGVYLFAASVLFIWLLPLSTLVLLSTIMVPVILLFYIVTTFLSIKRSATCSTSAFLLALLFFIIVIIYFILIMTGSYRFAQSQLAFVFCAFFGCVFSLIYAVMKLFILQRDEKITEQHSLLAKSSVQDALLKERLALQEQSHAELESLVDERTFELQVTLRELEEKNQALELLNMEDALTGVKNRRFFDKKIIMELRRSRREKTPLTIIMFDIDNFKLINDTYGHLTGDQVIKATADLIKDHLKRPLDEIARYGGEEFVVLLPNTPSEGAIDIAQRIRHAIQNNPVNVAGTYIQFTISAGMYTSVVDDINDPDFFTECADKALYYAKQHGRNQVITFPPPQ